MDFDVAVVKEALRSSRKSTPKLQGEVLSGPERRRWSDEEKLRVLAQSVAPGSSVSLTCRMHGISTGQLYTWRKQFRLGELTGFVPVAIVPDLSLSEPPEVPTMAASDPPMVGTIEIELPSGVNLRIADDVGDAILRRVLSALS